MDKHLTFEGIEFNIPLNKFISKLEMKGLVIDTPPFGDSIMTASLKGTYADYNGICKIIVTTDENGIVKTLLISGEDYYSVDAVLEDFDYFYSKAEEYQCLGFELLKEEDDYFDEDDIDSIRDGSLSKAALFERKIDNSVIMVHVTADDEYDTFHVSMSITCGEVSDKDMKIRQDKIEFLESQILQCESDHLVFNGVEMSGALDDFVEELEAKGFRVKKGSQWIENREIVTMYGPFMGEPCKLLLSSNEIGDISIVVVNKKERKSFDVVKDEFYKLLDVYSKKYGEPYELEDSLIYESNPIASLKNKDATLGAFFKVGAYGSSITLYVSIEEDSRFPYISIGYSDGASMSSTEEENTDWDDVDMDDYYDDI